MDTARSSGPYMVEGSEELDFTARPKDQQPLTGFVPNEKLQLVRNPSWQSGTDRLRPAYLDRIEIEIGHDIDDGVRAVSQAEADVVVGDRLPPLLVDRYQSDEAPT